MIFNQNCSLQNKEMYVKLKQNKGVHHVYNKKRNNFRKISPLL